MRKCCVCKEQIDVFGNDFVEDCFSTKSPKIYHINCYIDYMTSKKRGAVNIDTAKKRVSELRESTKKKYKDILAKDELYKFIQDMYGISFLSQYFFVKMDSVYKGEYKGLTKEVPPSDLLDMWKQKKDKLLEMADKDRRKGKDFDPIQRVWYDLAILLSKYDSYLDWKEKQKIAHAEYEAAKSKDVNLVSYDDICRPKAKTENIDSVDISSIIDEI